jgi:hypothetical protein
MRKLTLQLEALTVDSFVTDASGDGAGTVFGQDDTRITEFCTMYKTCLVTRLGCVTSTCAYKEDADDQPDEVRVPE